MRFLILTLFLFLQSLIAPGQCESARIICTKELKPYVSDGQYRSVNLNNNERKAYYCTFYGGRSYKITTALDNQAGNVHWELINSTGAVLYNSRNSNYKSSLKLKFNSTSTFKIEISLPDNNNKGCAVMLIGFEIDGSE